MMSHFIHIHFVRYFCLPVLQILCPVVTYMFRAKTSRTSFRLSGFPFQLSGTNCSQQAYCHTPTIINITHYNGLCSCYSIAIQVDLRQSFYLHNSSMYSIETQLMSGKIFKSGKVTFTSGRSFIA